MFVCPFELNFFYEQKKKGEQQGGAIDAMLFF